MSSKRAREALTTHWILDVKDIEAMSGTFTNTNWLVTSADRQYVLRQVADWRVSWSDDIEFELRFQHAILQGLERSDRFVYGVPNPVKTQHEQTFAKYGDTYYWLYELLPGSNKVELNMVEAKKVMDLTAQLHLHIYRNIDRLPKEPDLFYGSLLEHRLEEVSIRVHRKIREQGKPREYENSFLNRTKGLQVLIDHLNQIEVDLPVAPIHADISVKNLLWQDNRISSIIDFEFLPGTVMPLLQEITIFGTNAYLKYLKTNSDMFFDHIDQLIREFVKLWDRYRKRWGWSVPSGKKLLEQQLPYFAEFLLGTLLMFTLTTVDKQEEIDNPQTDTLYELVSTTYKNRGEINEWAETIFEK